MCPFMFIPTWTLLIRKHLDRLTYSQFFYFIFKGRSEINMSGHRIHFSLKMSDTTVHQCVHNAYNALRLIEKEQKCYCQWKASSNRTWLVQYFKNNLLWDRKVEYSLFFVFIFFRFFPLCGQSSFLARKKWDLTLFWSSKQYHGQGSKTKISLSENYSISDDI